MDDEQWTKHYLREVSRVPIWITALTTVVIGGLTVIYVVLYAFLLLRQGIVIAF